MIDLDEVTYDYPENADWGQLVDDYPTLCALAMKFVGIIKNDLQTETRRLVPGLRCALRNIAREIR